MIGNGRNCECGLLLTSFGRMNARFRLITVPLVGLLLLTSCTTKKASERKQRAAYAAGRQYGELAAAQAGVAKEGEPAITFSGDVEHRSIPWREDLTLAQAILEAGHNGRRDPRYIVVHRGGQEFKAPAWRLLRGDDFRIEPGDHIEFRR